MKDLIVKFVQRDYEDSSPSKQMIIAEGEQQITQNPIPEFRQGDVVIIGAVSYAIESIGRNLNLEGNRFVLTGFTYFVQPV